MYTTKNFRWGNPPIMRSISFPDGSAWQEKTVSTNQIGIDGQRVAEMQQSHYANAREAIGAASRIIARWRSGGWTEVEAVRAEAAPTETPLTDEQVATAAQTIVRGLSASPNWTFVWMRLSSYTQHGASKRRLFAAVQDQFRRIAQAVPVPAASEPDQRRVTGRLVGGRATPAASEPAPAPEPAMRRVRRIDLTKE